MIYNHTKKKHKSDESAPTVYTYKTKLVDVPACPHKMHQDVLWHVLYDDDLELIRDITLPSVTRIELESSGSSEIVSYVEICNNLSAMQTLFFIALNADEILRADLCSPTFCSTIWTCHGRPIPLCPYKATRFFQVSSLLFSLSPLLDILSNILSHTFAGYRDILCPPMDAQRKVHRPGDGRLNSNAIHSIIVLNLPSLSISPLY